MANKKMSFDSFRDKANAVHNNKYKDHLKAGNKLGSYEKSTYLTSRRSTDRLDFFIENYLPIAQTLYELCTYVQKNAPDSWFDLHLGNFMIRPSTNEIVITDPLA